MTRTRFFTALEQALRHDPEVRCYVTNLGALRLDRGGIFSYCPITYVAQRHGKGEFQTAQVIEAAAALGLRPRTRMCLIDAADGLAETQTRQRLETLWTLPWRQ